MIEHSYVRRVAATPFGISDVLIELQLIGISCQMFRLISATIFWVFTDSVPFVPLNTSMWVSPATMFAVLTNVT